MRIGLGRLGRWSELCHQSHPVRRMCFENPSTGTEKLGFQSTESDESADTHTLADVAAIICVRAVNNRPKCYARLMGVHSEITVLLYPVLYSDRWLPMKSMKT